MGLIYDDHGCDMLEDCQDLQFTLKDPFAVNTVEFFLLQLAQDPIVEVPWRQRGIRNVHALIASSIKGFFSERMMVDFPLPHSPVSTANQRIFAA